MKTIRNLKPEALWRYFYEISQIPRESKNEAMIRDYLIKFAKKHGLPCKQDAVGNILMKKKGAGGKPIVLQAHMDMVCEKDKDTVHNFRKDPIRLVREGAWMRADKTTLGADNGIGLAAMLAIAEDKSLTHPPLELLFTVDEETGLTGANKLKPDFLKAKTLINLDTEQKGYLYIGCAGGQNTEISLPIHYTQAPKGFKPVLIKVTGLRGGHSGTDIHLGLGNAIKLLNRLLLNASEKLDILLGSIEGGTKHNAIPREAEAVVYIKPSQMKALKKLADEHCSIFCSELGQIDHVQIIPNEPMNSDNKVISKQDASKIYQILSTVPHGPIRMSTAMNNVVVTSTNCALCYIKKSTFHLLTSQRSFIASAIREISDQVKAVGLLAGAKVRQNDGYPAWRPNMESPLLHSCIKVYKSLYEKQPKITAIHAGLECGVIGEKCPGIDMISFGPTIEHAHSPSEMVNIKSVKDFWDLLIHVLESLANN
jgi:dipeptidase D